MCYHGATRDNREADCFTLSACSPQTINVARVQCDDRKPNASPALAVTAGLFQQVAGAMIGDAGSGSE